MNIRRFQSDLPKFTTLSLGYRALYYYTSTLTLSSIEFENWFSRSSAIQFVLDEFRCLLLSDKSQSYQYICCQLPHTIFLSCLHSVLAPLHSTPLQRLLYLVWFHQIANEIFLNSNPLVLDLIHSIMQTLLWIVMFRNCWLSRFTKIQHIHSLSEFIQRV